MLRGRSSSFRGLRAAATALALVVLGCSKSAMNVEAPDTLYEQAVMEHANENYELAVQRYRELLDHYPLDPRAEEIELRIAHAHLANGSYPEAIAAFSDFQRMHPTSAHLPEVEYRIAQAYVEQMDTIDRDLGAARNAHQRLQSVIVRHPGSEFANQAQSQLRFVREHLARRELYVASYYFARDQYAAGWVRTATILTQFPETSTAATAAENLAEAASTQGDVATARLAAVAAAEIQRGRQDEPPMRLGSAGPALAALQAHLRTPPTPGDASAIGG